jgi:hypothetical protein
LPALYETHAGIAGGSGALTGASRWLTIGNLWSLRQACRIVLAVSRLSYQLKNGTCIPENITFAEPLIHTLDLRDEKEKSLISKGILPHVN